MSTTPLRKRLLQSLEGPLSTGCRDQQTSSLCQYAGSCRRQCLCPDRRGRYLAPSWLLWWQGMGAEEGRICQRMLGDRCHQVEDRRRPPGAADGAAPGPRGDCALGVGSPQAVQRAGCWRRGLHGRWCVGGPCRVQDASPAGRVAEGRMCSWDTERVAAPSSEGELSAR